MSWENEALNKVILLLGEKDNEYTEWIDKTRELEIEVNRDSDSYAILQELLPDFLELPEYLDSLKEDSSECKEEFLERCFEELKKSYQQ